MCHKQYLSRCSDKELIELNKPVEIVVSEVNYQDRMIRFSPASESSSEDTADTSAEA